MRHRARPDPRRPMPQGQAEQREHVAQYPGVVHFLERHVQPYAVALGSDQAVELRQPDAEAFRLVRLRGGEQPEDARVETVLGPSPVQVAQVGGSIDGHRRPERLGGERREEGLASREHPPSQIWLAVALDEEPKVAVGVALHDLTTARFLPATRSARRAPLPAPPPAAPRRPPRWRELAPPAACRCRPATNPGESASSLTSWT